MSTDADDTADYSPPASPIQSAPRQADQVRHGETAPAHDHGSLPADTAELDEVLTRARLLFGMVRDESRAFNDPSYRHLRAGLISLYGQLKKQVKDDLADDKLFDLMFEVQSYMLRKDFA